MLVCMFVLDFSRGHVLFTYANVALLLPFLCLHHLIMRNYAFHVTVLTIIFTNVSLQDSEPPVPHWELKVEGRLLDEVIVKDCRISNMSL